MTRRDRIALAVPRVRCRSISPPPAALLDRPYQVTKATAAELAKAHPAEFIERKVEVFDWLVEKKDKRVAKNPTGYLVESIRSDYAAPKGFESKADRERRQAAEQERQRQEAEAKRREREQQARERAEHAKVLKHWNGLDQAEREQLDREALERAEPSIATVYRDFQKVNNAMIYTYFKTNMREPYIRRLLGLGDTLAAQ